MIDLPGLIDTYGYWAVFVGAFLEGETILALAGLAAYREYLDLRWVILVALMAGFLGDQFYFFLGRYKGEDLLRSHPNWRARAHKFDLLLARWHAPLIIGIRFMYGFRIAGPIMLGMGRVAAWKFMLYNFIGAAIWAPLITCIGYFFGSAIEAMIGHLKRYELWAAGGLLAVGLIIFAVQHIRQKHEDEAEAPPDRVV